MKRSTFWMLAGLASYYVISKKLKDKESLLSKCIEKYADKVYCMITKIVEEKNKLKKENEGEGSSEMS